MLLRVTIGVVVLLGLVSVGAWVTRERIVADRRSVRGRLAGQVHRTVGIVAVAIVAVLAATAVRYLV